MKYYTLKELKPGMRVSVASLDKIVGTTIGLDVRTYVKDDKEIGFADILYIGSDAKEKEGLSVRDVLCICNTYDVAKEEFIRIWQEDSKCSDEDYSLSEDISYIEDGLFRCPNCGEIMILVTDPDHFYSCPGCGKSFSYVNRVEIKTI